MKRQPHFRCEMIYCSHLRLSFEWGKCQDLGTNNNNVLDVAAKINVKRFYRIYGCIGSFCGQSILLT